MNQQIQSSTKQTMIDVLIVGAGPTGLAAALVLAKRGIRFRLIEKGTQRSPHSKALALQARTLEILELQSPRLADACVRGGYTAPGGTLSAGRDSVTVDFWGLDTRYPYFLFIPQVKTEELLEAHLAELGQTIERGVELKALTQGTDDTTAQLHYANGQTEEVHARYVLGCDGAHSVVRHSLGLPFPGKGYPWTAFLADVKIDGELAKKGLAQFSSERGLAMFFPFQDGYNRVITIDSAYQNSSEHEEPTLDELQESVNAIVPVPTRLSEPRWKTRWSSQLRQVTRYRVGRVFVAGDAAHIHSPAGGQGLNTGIQDAYNLTWKLALVLRGEAPESLLDTYHAERYPVGQHAMTTSDLVLRSALLPNKFARQTRDFIVKTFLPLPPLQHMISKSLSELDINYRHTQRGSQLLKLLSGQHALQAGDRVPNLELKPAVLTAAMSTSVSLYDLLRQAPYSLFIEIAPEHFEQDRQQITNLLDSVRQFAGQPINSFVVFGQGVETVAKNLDATALIDFKQQFHHKIGAQHGSILLVRPDGYLAMHVRNLQQEQFLSELQKWIVPVKQAADTLISERV